ncbi:unnamed protein product [Ixodes pacificus]
MQNAGKLVLSRSTNDTGVFQVVSFLHLNLCGGRAWFQGQGTSNFMRSKIYQIRSRRWCSFQRYQVHAGLPG